MRFPLPRSPRHRSESVGFVSRWRKVSLAAAASVALISSGVVAQAAFASSVTSAVFSGTTGTVSAGGTLYAKQGAALTLTVVTSSDTKCVDVTGTATLPRQTSSTAKTNWTFSTTAPAGDGPQAFTVAASPNFNANGCTGQTNSTQASYTVDNTGPVITAVLSPAPTSAGWNNTAVTVNWTATDTGVGVSAAQPFQSDGPITANGITTKTAPAQSDRLGNTGAGGSVTVRVDKAAPTITAAQTRNADGTTTITFTCDDALSGISTCLADGTTTNSKTVQPGVTVTGTATDKAGNTSTASSTAPAGDTTAPLLSGSPTTSPNLAGWYKGDVTVHWTASDPESGIPTQPSDTTITGEGTGLTSSQTVKNGAGLSTTALSSPAVKIDHTAPTTGISGTSNNWVNGSVTVSLTPTDNLSQVASTKYTVDGGSVQTGTSIALSTEGDHTITYFSTDNAGNVEATQTAHVKIDKTAPTIGHAFTPTAYTNGAWTNQDVTVTFTCADQGGSGVASCTSPVTKSAEGQYTVTGTAADNAGNTATDSASVNIDKTAPTITATANGTKNAAGWYNDDVTVTYAVADAGGSGIASSPASDVLHEGSNQSAHGTVTDGAGNSASDGVTGINVDNTAPALSGSFSSGWHTGNVTVKWTCTDALSGPVAQPADTVVTGEGTNLSATASCTDVAGNTTTKTVSGIDIDRSAPTTTVSVPAVPASGWYKDAVTVTLSGHDNLSGIDTTYYAVDGGNPQTYSGAFSFATEGTHSISYWSKDGAGNLETAGAPLTLSIDTSAPTTTVVLPEVDGSNGWYVTSGLPIAFNAKDTGGSGLAATYYSIDGGATQTYGVPFTADLGTGTHTITYWSVDVAGNGEAHASTDTSNTVDVLVDTDKPTITGTATPAANSFGWNNSDVAVHFTCADVGSGVQTGVAGCAGDTTLTNDGANQFVPGDAIDNAGNTSTTSFGPINVDTVKPTLVGVPDDPNAAKWYNHDVTVKWVGDDGLSGLDPATQPKDSIVTGEGSNLGAGPVTISDQAGNVSAAASVSGLKIDRTAPVITGAPTTKPNAAGWYTSAVTIDYTCSDPVLADKTAGSGWATCPTSSQLKTDGALQSVTSGSATDVAGNVAAGIVVGGINIDGTAPVTTANNQCTATNGWCTGDNANVVLTATDNLSGVKAIHYTIDGGAEKVVTGSSTTVSVPLTGSGAGTVKYWSVDNADNAESANSVSLKWDNIAPTVTHTVSPVPNAAGWTTADTTVTFAAKDDDNGSGIAAGSLTAPVTVSTETNGQLVTGTATDTAGNVGGDSAMVMLDKTKPTISASITSGTKGNGGWYVGPVTVHFTCSDALSGIPATACPSDVTLSENGSDQSASGSVADAAGNSASAGVTGINIDQEKPTLTPADVTVQGSTYTLGSVPTAKCTASDSYSGVASCTVVVTGGNANGVGSFAYTATATDNAGNQTVLKGTYSVVYRFDGFLQPINDTAHQVGTTTSVFKAGSTVPVKLQLKNAAGTVVQSATAPIWLTPAKGSAMSAPVDESVYSATADSGSTYKYDSTAQQYIYNWKTGTGGNYYRIGVTLDDGQTYYVNIGLK